MRALLLYRHFSSTTRPFGADESRQTKLNQGNLTPFITIYRNEWMPIFPHRHAVAFAKNLELAGTCDTLNWSLDLSKKS
jgi:hypothetical protein